MTDPLEDIRQAAAALRQQREKVEIQAKTFRLNNPVQQGTVMFAVEIPMVPTTTMHVEEEPQLDSSVSYLDDYTWCDGCGYLVSSEYVVEGRFWSVPDPQSEGYYSHNEGWLITEEPSLDEIEGWLCTDCQTLHGEEPNWGAWQCDNCEAVWRTKNEASECCQKKEDS